MNVFKPPSKYTYTNQKPSKDFIRMSNSTKGSKENLEIIVRPLAAGRVLKSKEKKPEKEKNSEKPAKKTEIAVSTI